MSNPTKSQPAKDDSHPDFPHTHSFWTRTKHVADAIGPFAVVVGFLFAILGGADLLIEKKLSSPVILRKIASEARPMVIFSVSTNGIASITKDAGAARFIKDHRIDVTERTPEGWPKQIRIDFTDCLDFPPALSAVYDSVIVIPSHDGGCAWRFEIQPVIQLADDPSLRVYRLELIW
jgi:hypothetical protein